MAFRNDRIFFTRPAEHSTNEFRNYLVENHYDLKIDALYSFFCSLFYAHKILGAIWDAPTPLALPITHYIRL